MSLPRSIVKKALPGPVRKALRRSWGLFASKRQSAATQASSLMAGLNSRVALRNVHRSVTAESLQTTRQGKTAELASLLERIDLIESQQQELGVFRSTSTGAQANNDQWHETLSSNIATNRKMIDALQASVTNFFADAGSRDSGAEPALLSDFWQFQSTFFSRLDAISQRFDYLEQKVSHLEQVESTRSDID